jgi:hypothetical protein
LTTGEDLLVWVRAARDVVAVHAGKSRPALREFAEVREAVDPLRQALRTWLAANSRQVTRFFGASGKSIYGVAPAPKSHPVMEDSLDDVEKLIVIRSGELRTILDRVGGTRTHSANEATNVDLTFVRASGLLEAGVVDDFVRRLGGLRDRRNLGRVIGASKELVEAVNHAALAVLGEPPGLTDDFQKLGKMTRQAITTRIGQVRPTGSPVEATSVKFQAGLTTVLQGLAEMRNDFGEGHGRRRVPAGVEVRHGRLAQDCALAYSGYLISALEDLGAI